MGFFSAAATGFAKQQNADFADQQQQQDQLTRASLSNILKNVDNYNQSKAEYQQKQTKAEAIAAQTGLQTGDVMGMMNMGFDTPQIIQQSLHKQTTPAPSGNVNQQTQTAMPGAGGTTTPATTTTTTAGTNPSVTGAAPQAQPSDPTTGASSEDTSIGSSNQGVPPATAQQDQSQPQIPGIRKTAFDTITGNDPSAKVGQNAMGQAGTVTGMSPDGLSQARTGHYTPADLPTTSGFKIDPSALVDWSKFDPSHYSSKNLPAAINAMKQGDTATAVGLADNADDKTKRELSLVYARAGATANADAAVETAKDAAAVTALAQHIDPATGQPYGAARAQQIMDAQKYHSGMTALGVAGDPAETLNPQHLDPQTLYQTLDPSKKAFLDGYRSGRVPWVTGSGKAGIQAQQDILKQIQQVEPDFTPAVGKARTAQYMDLMKTTGNSTGAKLVNSATAINHMVDFAQAIKAVGNTHSFTTRNDVSNFFASKNSDSPLKNANNARDLTAEELAKFLAEKNAGATDADKARVIDMMPLDYGGKNPKTGVDNNQEIMDGLLHLMVGKLGPIADKINDNFGTEINAYDLLPQESLQKLRDLGYKVPEGSGQTVSATGVPLPRLPGHSIAPENWANQTGPGPNAPAIDQSNPPPSNKLQEGHVTNFANGQAWQLINGQPQRVK